MVFDTETTGLDVFHDDIVQIAAVKMSNGQIVPGSALSLFIRTERPIPEKLGDIDNPIIEELKHHELLEPAEALRRFVDYVGARPLLGHNADYDYHILDHNLRRYCPEIQLSSRQRLRHAVGHERTNIMSRRWRGCVMCSTILPPT